MKKLGILFGIFFIIASAVMIHLTRGGISVRSAPIIAPSPQGEGYKNIAPAIVMRLYPDFQNANYVLFGFSSEMKAANQVINDMKLEFEKTFKKSVSVLMDDGSLSVEKLNQCNKPCWILTSENQAHELSTENKIPALLNQVTGGNHFHMTLIPFDKIPDPSDECVAEKRLSLPCLISLSLHEVRKKFKDKDASYFLMRKYLDRDYFLLIQSGPLQP